MVRSSLTPNVVAHLHLSTGEASKLEQEIFASTNDHPDFALVNTSSFATGLRVQLRTDHDCRTIKGRANLVEALSDCAVEANMLEKVLAVELELFGFYIYE